MEKEELLHVDDIKTILMIIITTGHCICVFRTTGWGGYKVSNPKYFFDIINGYSDYITYAFCTVSGYLYFYNRIYCNKYDNVIGTIVHRSQRLLLPYFLGGTLWCYPVGGGYCTSMILR